LLLALDEVQGQPKETWVLSRATMRQGGCQKSRPIAGTVPLIAANQGDCPADQSDRSTCPGDRSGLWLL